MGQGHAAALFELANKQSVRQNAESLFNASLLQFESLKDTVIEMERGYDSHDPAWADHAFARKLENAIETTQKLATLDIRKALEIATIATTDLFYNFSVFHNQDVHIPLRKGSPITQFSKAVDARKNAASISPEEDTNIAFELQKKWTQLAIEGTLKLFYELRSSHPDARIEPIPGIENQLRRIDPPDFTAVEDVIDVKAFMSAVSAISLQTAEMQLPQHVTK